MISQSVYGHVLLKNRRFALCISLSPRPASGVTQLASPECTEGGAQGVAWTWPGCSSGEPRTLFSNCGRGRMDGSWQWFQEHLRTRYHLLPRKASGSEALLTTRLGCSGVSREMLWCGLSRPHPCPDLLSPEGAAAVLSRDHCPPTEPQTQKCHSLQGF